MEMDMVPVQAVYEWIWHKRQREKGAHSVLVKVGVAHSWPRYVAVYEFLGPQHEQSTSCDSAQEEQG
jgi:hypothetical protein